MKRVEFILVMVLMALSLQLNRLNAQVVISTPSLGFTQACASPDFNSYNISFSFSPESALASTNQFVLELSDDSGSFDNPVILYTSNQGEIISSPVTLNFALPEDIAGEEFKVRVKATQPAATSAGSQSFAAYFKSQDSPFSINNLIDTGVFCPNGSYLLTIDDPGGPQNDSPLQYPNLTFNWYKETSSTTAVFISSGNSLLVSEEGVYFVETNYGSCTSNSFSNRVTISEASNSNEFEISSSLGNPYCSSEGATTLSAISGSSYQWFRDGELIPGANEQSLETAESGVYSVNVDLGECSADASITLETTGFSASIDVEEVTVIEEDQSIWVTVDTDAVDPIYTWTFNGTEISGSSEDFYEVTQPGVYAVLVTQTSGCEGTTMIEFRVMEAFPDVDNIPNVISPNNDGINDTWVIPQQYTAGSNADVQIINAQGELVYRTNEYNNDWPQEPIYFGEVNPIFYYIIDSDQGTKKGTITVVK